MIKNQVCGDMGIAGVGAVQLTESGKVADSARIVRNASTLITIQTKTPEEISFPRELPNSMHPTPVSHH